MLTPARFLLPIVLLVVGALVAAPTALGATAVPPDENRVGFATDIGGLNDRSFNALTKRGIERAQSRLGMSGTILETKFFSDQERNLERLASEGNGLVLTTGILMSDPLKEVAAKHPDTRFAITDFTYAGASGRGWDATSNVTGVLFDERQAGYLVGALAGEIERRRGLPGMNRERVLSVIAGLPIPPVGRYVAGFRQGVRSTCANCRILVNYSQDFLDQRKCRSLARSQIKRKSDIIFVIAGGCGLGAHAVAKANRIWSIGADSDQGYLGRHVLTSAIKRVDVATFDLARRSQSGTLEGGRTLRYGLREDGVGVGRITPPARKYAKAVERAKARLLAKQGS